MCNICVDQRVEDKQCICICPNVSALPKNLNKIILLDAYNTTIKSIPSYPTLITLNLTNNLFIEELPNHLPNLDELYISNTNLTSIPKTYIKLKILGCDYSNVEELPDTLVNLEYISCYGTKINTIPSSYKKIKRFKNSNVDCVYTTSDHQIISNTIVKYFDLKKVITIQRLFKMKKSRMTCSQSVMI